MNKNMRKMYTEEEIVNFIKKSGNLIPFKQYGVTIDEETDHLAISMHLEETLYGINIVNSSDDILFVGILITQRKSNPVYYGIGKELLDNTVVSMDYDVGTGELYLSTYDGSIKNFAEDDYTITLIPLL